MEHRRHVFSVDLLERYAAKGKGVITCMTSGNDVIVLGTSKGWVIRQILASAILLSASSFSHFHEHFQPSFHVLGSCIMEQLPERADYPHSFWALLLGFQVLHNLGSTDIDLSVGRSGEQSIHRVFVDPGGSHCIATVVGGGTSDTFYMHAKWAKPRILSKLKGLVVNDVAWNKQHITEASTREILLGTDDRLYEIAVDEKDEREKYIKFWFQLNELPEAFTGLQMETAHLHNGTRYYVMAVTPTRLYSFTGNGSLDTGKIFLSGLSLRPMT